MNELMKKRSDEYIEFMHEEFPDLVIGEKPSAEFKAKYKDTFPEHIFYYWEHLGFANIFNGGFWLVNPIDYEDILDTILQQTKFLQHDEFFVIGRGAFGDLYAVGKNTPSSLTIDMNLFRIFPSIRPYEDDFGMLTHFLTKISNLELKYIDLYDEYGEYLLNRCIQEYGALSSDEVYALVPPRLLGGKSNLLNIKKENVLSHLSFLAQLDTPEIMMDINAYVDQQGIKP